MVEKRVADHADSKDADNPVQLRHVIHDREDLLGRGCNCRKGGTTDRRHNHNQTGFEPDAISARPGLPGRAAFSETRGNKAVAIGTARIAYGRK